MKSQLKSGTNDSSRLSLPDRVYSWRYYIVSNLIPYQPRLLTTAFASKKQAENFLRFQELSSRYYDIISGRWAIAYDLKFTNEWWRHKTRHSKRKTTWEYPEWCKTRTQRRDFRTNSRRRIRKEVPHLFPDYGKNRWWFFTKKKDEYAPRRPI